MFNPPAVIEAKIFARIPDSYRVTNRRSPWVDVQFHGAPTPFFLEGPSFDREGNLWVVDIPWGRIFRIAPDASVTLVTEYDGEPNGLKFHKDGRVFIADHRYGIMLLEPATGRVTAVLDRPKLERFKGVNDLVFASNGDLYFTDQGQTGHHDPTGRLYRLRASGQLDCVLQDIPSPNGLVLNAEENTVFLAVTRANAVWRVPMTKDGTATKVGTYIQMSGGGGPDGMAIDEQGGLAVCHVGFGATWIFSPRGEPTHRIESPVGIFTTNCAYGGPDRKRLFIIESKSGTIMTADVPVAGRRMFSHQD